MAFIPSALLKKLYTYSSLENVNEGVQFSIKNRLSDAQVTGVHHIKLNGQPIALDQIQLCLEDGQLISPSDVDGNRPIDFPLRAKVNIIAHTPALNEGQHNIEIAFQSKPFGKIKFNVDDNLSSNGHLNGHQKAENRIPRNDRDDYSPEAIAERQAFVEKFSNTQLNHVKQYSVDPQTLKGNIEQFTGVAQIPLGFAGPLMVDGEHAQGEFLIPLATTEGTLVASYNRGIKLMNACGGVKTTILADAMQRAPVFVFSDSRGARDFDRWLSQNFDPIREIAESTSSIAKLIEIDTYLANKFVYTRFNFTTGDAAGQNMVGKATFEACNWILTNYQGPQPEHFYLEANFATDKKSSHINIMRTRGKRVAAEVTIPQEILTKHMQTTVDSLTYHYQVANIGSFMAGVNNNGLHSTNAVTAIFVATGQDIANVAESSTAILYAEKTPNGDLYVNLTLPSLIVATHGGGTGLGTQKECLALIDCVGKGKVNKLAEIIAATALAGELSLASAISASDWVSSHEALGRNR